MNSRGVTEAQVEEALWTARTSHEPHHTRPGSYYARVPAKPSMWVVYRPLNGDDFVITVTPRTGK
jgi:hypothetical protein